MTGLETMIDEAVKNGLVGFTLFQTQDGRWQANMTFDRLGWQCKFGASPFEAAIALLAPTVMPQNVDPEDIFG